MKKYRYFLTVVSVVGFVLSSSVIWADDSDNHVSEEEVVVTASRTAEPESQAPGKTEVITKEDIEESGATTVAEALTDAGVNVSSYGGKSGAATVQLDGSNSFQTLVLVNGVPANVGPDGSTDLSYFPVEAIERIEISHGPLSALYGSSAVGGVVNIITDLTGQSLTEANLRAGNFNTKGMDVRYQQENWGLVAGGDKTDGFTEHTKTYSNYLMGQYNFFQTNQEYLKLYWQALGKHEELQNSTAEESDQDIALNLDGLSNILGGAWEYKIYSQHYDLHYEDTDPYRHQILSYGIDSAGQYQLGSHELLTGVSLKQEGFESTTFGDHSRNDNALFLQDSWQLVGPLKLIMGLRQDYYTDFTSPLLPKITLVDAITDQFTVKAGYGRTFRAPSFEDLYWISEGMYGDPDLKPEQGGRYDLVAEWKKDQQSVTADFYYSHLHNYILWGPDETGVSWTALNLNEAVINGFNINWENTWANFITADIGYHYVDEVATDATLGVDKDYNYYGKNQFNLGLRLKYKAWQYGMNWNLVRDREFYSYGDQSLPDYNVLNLNVKYQMNQHLNFAIAVDNSTDKYYEVKKGYSMPGRTYTFSTKYTF